MTTTTTSAETDHSAQTTETETETETPNNYDADLVATLRRQRLDALEPDAEAKAQPWYPDGVMDSRACGVTRAEREAAEAGRYRLPAAHGGRGANPPDTTPRGGSRETDDRKRAIIEFLARAYHERGNQWVTASRLGFTLGYAPQQIGQACQELEREGVLEQYTKRPGAPWRLRGLEGTTTTGRVADWPRTFPRQRLDLRTIDTDDHATTDTDSQ